MGAEDGPELELLEQDLVEALLGKDKNVVCSVTCGGSGATKTNIKQGGNGVPLTHMIVEMFLVFCPVF